MVVCDVSCCVKQNTTYEVLISDWSTDVCSSECDPVADDDLLGRPVSGECLGKSGHYLCPFSLLLGPGKKRGSKLFDPLILEYAMSVGFKLRDKRCDAEYLDQDAVWVCLSEIGRAHV